MYRIGFYGCAHLGYRQRGMNRRHHTGINLREADGYTAHSLIYEDMLACGVAGIVDGGDLFHIESPSVQSVNTALRIDDKRVAACDGRSIWRITNGGNHDNGASTHLSAVSHVHRSWLDSTSVFPDLTRDPQEETGPWPGFYEVHQPDPDIPLYLHVVSHNGLDSSLADRGIVVDPKPIDDAVNILVSHGIFSADGRLFGADDRHGAHRVIPEDWVNRGWDHTILSDYHTLGPIPGFGPQDGRERGQVWMTGSAVRRGFSDEACPRGWLELALHDDGRVEIIPHYIWQRPQVDFPVIDAREFTVAEIDETVRMRLRGQVLTDEQSRDLTGDGGIIVRQVITHTSQQQRQQLAAHRIEWARMAADAAYWSADYVKPQSAAMSCDTSVAVRAQQRRSLADEFAHRRNRGRVGIVLEELKANDADLAETVATKVGAMLAGLSRGE